jgi:branched-chain amino acid transport system ATP-binding protein
VTAAPEQATPLVEARELVAGYLPGVDILNGCSLTLFDGEIVGVVGPNGAGKSTLVKAMFGLVTVRSGSVLHNGEDVTNTPAHSLVARGIGYVPQRDNVFPSLTIEENLRMGTYLSPKDFDSRVDDVVGLFPLLGERRRQRADALSGGERQMLAMGRALMMTPSVLFLDEPSAGLAPMLQDQVFERVVQVNESGVAVIMVEQNARRCLEISNRAYVLDQGRDAYTGSGQELLVDPKVIELYLGTLGARAGGPEAPRDT